MYQKTVLDNNLRVVTHDMKDRQSVALGFLIGSGGRYENDDNKGAAHFLEHILFKGSKKYSCSEIKEKIEGVGGSLNAFTSEEQTCYFAKIPAKHLNKTFDILADMVFHPLIAKTDVNKERTVILEEIKMYQDLPQYLVMELLDELVWPDHPLGKKLTGTFESVGRMGNQDLREFHARNYHPGNIVICVCGNLSHKSVVDMAKRKLKSANSQKSVIFKGAQNTQNKAKVRFYRKDIEQMHLALGMFGLDTNHADRYALGFLNVILGGNMSSRLFNEVREKRGLAYSIGSSAKFLRDTGLFLVRAGVDNKKIVEAAGLILKELRKIKEKGITADEYSRARDYFQGQVLLELEDTLEHMLWIGESTLIRDKMMTIKEIIAKLKKVTPADIKRVARLILKEEHFNLAVVGPLNDSQEKDLGRLLGV